MRIAENLNRFQAHPDDFDTINIVVDGSPSSDLLFAGLTEEMDTILSLGKNICIELFLDLHTETFSFFNELEFSLRKRSLEALLEKLKDIPENRISHIILYRGLTDFGSLIKRHSITGEEYTEWKESLIGNAIDEEHLLHLFSCQLLSNFFHSIASILPDHLRGALLFFLPYSLESAKIAELVSEETFSHLEVGIRNPSYFFEGIAMGNGQGFSSLSYDPVTLTREDTVKTGVVLPFLGSCNYKRFEEVCNKLEAKNIPFKIIEENLLNEKWFDIDYLLFDNDNTSFDGKRMLDGFIAAGGKAFSFTSADKTRENITTDEGFLPLEHFSLLQPSP